MDAEKKSRLINIIALVEIAASVLIMSLGMLKGFLTSSQANIVVGVGLFIFWLLSDIVEPYVCGRFQEITFAQKEAYVKYTAFDLAGYAGILYFLAGIGNNGQSGGILGAVIYVVSMKPKRDNRDIFLGYTKEEDDEEEETEDAIDGEVIEETDNKEE